MDDQLVPERLNIRRARLLALARIFIGALFIETWFENLHKGLYGTSGYAHFVRGYADTTATPGMGWFIDHVVAPNAAVFSKAQLVAELLLIGIPLLIGLFTPVGGLIGTGFALNLTFANLGGPDWWGTYAMLVVLLLVVTLSRSGRTWGLDAVLVRRRAAPRWPLY
jgi:uncharacterized membrane protein YphA (DoxX/SURF4 family)